MPAEILVESLYYAYPPWKPGMASPPALRGVSFQVARGEFVALLGRVGAGKTTLCMALNGLVPHATGGVFRGNVTVAGLNTREHSVADLARTASLVFQDPETQLVQMRVEDEIAFGLENLGLPSAEIEERVSWALDAVGLADYRERSPLLLSGGEKQRVAIAAMIAMRSQVLVLDEPTASLDPAGKSAVSAVLAELRRRHEVTIVTATQELERVARFADRVLVLHDGAIALEGPPAEVFQKVGKLQEWGLGVPQWAELGYALAQRRRSVAPPSAPKTVPQGYRFAGIADAYKKLRRQVHKLNLHKVEARDTLLLSPRPHPLADRMQVAIENLSFTYSDGTVALRDVSLTLHPGEFVALLGPNGSGKTTLAKHLDGLNKPTAGRVMVELTDTRTARVADLARRVGYAFQNPDHQIFAATVQAEIAFGPRIQDLPEPIVAQRVAEVLDRFHLVACADLPPAVLSFGQRRQVALAAVIASQPQVLILDEPTGGLDWQSRQELMDVVTSFNILGRTVVLATHDMRLVAEYATRAIVLLDGRIVFDGTPRTLFSQPEILAQARLALPPVTRLANRLHREGMVPGVLTVAEFAAIWRDWLKIRTRGKRQGPAGHDKIKKADRTEAKGAGDHVR